jgi:hypothetical protein
MTGIALEAETLAGYLPRLTLAAMPWVHNTDTEEPGYFLEAMVPRLSSCGAGSQCKGSSTDRDAA